MELDPATVLPSKYVAGRGSIVWHLMQPVLRFRSSHEVLQAAFPLQLIPDEHKDLVVHTYDQHKIVDFFMDILSSNVRRAFAV